MECLPINHLRGFKRVRGTVELLNSDTNQIIAKEVTIANTFLSRLIGLLDKKELPFDNGLWLIPCNSIHTFGLKFNIDAIFLNKNNTIVYLMENLGKNKISPVIFAAHSVLEIVQGTIKTSNSAVGHKITVM